MLTEATCDLRQCIAARQGQAVIRRVQLVDGIRRLLAEIDQT